MSTMDIVTIDGGRQSGKTHALLDIAAKEAEVGQKVLWFADSMRSAASAHDRFQSRINSDLIQKVWHANGIRRIDTTSGGEVVFLSARSNSGRGHTADILIFDGTPVDNDALPCIAGSPHGRVYATTGMAVEPKRQNTGHPLLA